MTKLLLHIAEAAADVNSSASSQDSIFTVNDILTLIGVLISIIALILSYKAKKNSEASLDNSFLSSLSHAEEKYLDVAYSTKNMNDSSYYNEIKLSLLNQYDMLCSQYLNHRINKKEFEINYAIAIIRIVESDRFKFVDKYWAYYPNLHKVYEIFKNKKKD